MPDFLTTDQKTALGSLVYRAGDLEHTVDWMFEALLGVNGRLYKTLTEDRMLGWKLDAFKEVGLAKLRTKTQRRRFAQIMDELKGLNGQRAVAVHGEWLPGGTGVSFTELLGMSPVRAAVAKHRRRRSKKLTELKAERLEKLATQLEVAHGALAHFFMDQWMRAAARRAARRAVRSRQTANARGSGGS